MGKKLLAIVTFALICCGSVVFAQNSNSNTMTQMNGSMMGHNMNSMSRRRRHRRVRHKKHRRHRRVVVNKNANM